MAITVVSSSGRQAEADYVASEDGSVVTVIIPLASYAALSLPGATRPMPEPSLPAGKTWVFIGAREGELFDSGKIYLQEEDAFQAGDKIYLVKNKKLIEIDNKDKKLTVNEKKLKGTVVTSEGTLVDGVFI